MLRFFWDRKTITHQNLFGIIHIYLPFVSLICMHPQKYFLQLENQIELGSSVKQSISEITLFEYAPWIYGISVVLHSFSFFTVEVTFEVTSCIFVLKWCFSCSNSLVSLPFSLGHHIRQYNREMMRCE